MKYMIFFLLFSSIFLASCGLTKTEVSEVADDLIQIQAEQDSASETITVNEGDMMQKDEMMIDENHEGEWTEEEMREMEIMNEEPMEDTMMDEENSEDIMMENDTKMMQSEGSYIAYDASLVGKTENTVLFFHANWCPSCRAADAGISAGEIPTGLTILKTDYDTQTELKKKYGIIAQHTFVQVDAEGNMIKKWLGGASVEDITKNLK